MHPTLARRLVLSGMALCLLANAGCLAAAAVAGTAAAGGTAGYFYLKGNVRDEFNADFNATWAAAKGALADLQMPVTRENRNDKHGTIETKTGTGVAVTLTLDSLVSQVPADGPLTRVGVRVGTLGDAAVSDRIQEQIAFRLFPAPPVPPAFVPPGNGVAPAGFQTPPPPLADPQKSWQLQPK